MKIFDTIIVGAGPAGSSAAKELVGAGRSCVILDRKKMPRLKLCGGWITEKVLADLKLDPATYPYGIVKLDRFRFFLGRRHLFSREVAAVQYSIRRIEFDNWLYERSGASLIEHTVRDIARENGEFIIDGEYRCRNLIGAGGTNCPVKKNFFQADAGRLIVAQEVEYEVRPKSAVCSLWFPYAGPFGYAWYVPKANAINIGFGGLRSQNENWDKESLWSRFVELLRKTGCIDGEPPAPKGYSYYIGSRRKKICNERAYIVGDAAGLATEDLAEGIGPAIESGQLAAREILGVDRYSLDRITQYSLPWPSRLIRNYFSWIP
jgi:menaquinone-9 beta-reductase